MNLYELKEQMSDLDGQYRMSFVGTGISPLRIGLIINIVDILASYDRETRLPFYPDKQLAAHDNSTNATWLARKLVFCLTQYFDSGDLGSPIRELPEDVIANILKQSDLTPESVFLFLGQARDIEVEELVIAGSLAYAFARQ